MLPEFDAEGDLPPGIYSASLSEIEMRLSGFAFSDRRVRLFAKLRQIVEKAEASSIVERVITGGSFVSANPEPNDVDVVIVLSKDVTFDALTPTQYVVTDRDALRRVFKGEDLDVIVVRESTKQMQTAIEFFQTNRDNKSVGVVEVKL